jgi:YesN/AraC family two-component response regulator
VLQASDGSEALEIFREHSDDISLVLTDITMPVMGGLETLRNLRQIDPGIKVILSSGYSEEDALSAQTGEKLADFIQKPYKANDLISKVTEVLKKK